MKYSEAAAEIEFIGCCDVYWLAKGMCLLIGYQLFSPVLATFIPGSKGLMTTTRS